MSDGWIAMPLSALGFALQLADTPRPHWEWIEVDSEPSWDEIDLRHEVSVQMFITELAPELTAAHTAW